MGDPEVEHSAEGPMSETTRAIQERSTATLECDVPEGMTLAEYRAARAGEPVKRRRRWRRPRELRRAA